MFICAAGDIHGAIDRMYDDVLAFEASLGSHHLRPARMNGQPCVRNLRLTVKRVLEALAVYPDRAELFREYPELEDDDIGQVLAYAAAALDDKVIELPKRA